MQTLRVPPNVTLSYAAEGGANVVYRISLSPTSSSPPQPPSPTLDAGRGSGDDRYGASTPLPSELPDWGESEEEEASSSPGHGAEEKEAAESQHVTASLFQGKVLRLRKKVKSATGVLQAHRDYVRLMAPLFEAGNLVEQRLVEVPVRVVGRLNEGLMALEREGGRRREERRCGVYLSVQERYGVLMEDLKGPLAGGGEGKGKGGGSVTVEIKPKWLAQSPSAPIGARNCRTCALRLMRRAEKKRKREEGGRGEGRGEDNSVVDVGEQAEERGAMCPLDLVAGDGRRVVELAARIIRPDMYASVEERRSLERYLVDFVTQDPLLRRLRDIQCRLNPAGVIAADPHEENVRMAMTLRDCSLYLKLPLHSEGKVQAKFGDLDLKSSSKGGYWESVERQLIDGGWYMMDERITGSDRLMCSLQEQS